MIRFPEELNFWSRDVLPLVDALLNDRGEVVACDASRLKWTMPIGLCGLAAACHTLSERGQTVKFEGLQGHMVNYFERMDVFDHCHVQHLHGIQKSNLSDSLFELRCLTVPREVESAVSPLVASITGQMMVGFDDSEDPDGMQVRPSAKMAQSLHYVLSELLENALTHSQGHGFRGARVWVAANYFAKSGAVQIGVVDTGCGFLRSLRTHQGVRDSPTHGRAIKLGLEPYVSCNKAVGIMDDSSNQGIGLTISAAIAGRCGGQLEVNSGNASVKATSGQIMTGQRDWQGAALDVRMLRNQLLALDLPTLIRPYQRQPRPKLRFEG